MSSKSSLLVKYNRKMKEKLIALCVALLAIFVILVILQILYIRTTMLKFENNEEYKKSLVRTANEISLDRRFVMEFYSIHPNIPVTTALNTGIITYLSNTLIVPEMYVPTLFKGNVVTTPFTPKDYFLLALQTTSSSLKLQHDVMSNKVKYILIGSKVYSVCCPETLQNSIVSYINQNPTDNLTTQTINTNVLLLLVPMPYYKDVLPELGEFSDWRVQVISFMGATTGDFEDFTALLTYDVNAAFHVIGYKV